MPLLCISLLVLLLLPQSLTCDRNQFLRDAPELYNAIVKTDLDNTRENISASLQEISCPQLRFKAENCTPNTSDELNTLHKLACRMITLNLAQTKRLTESVLRSIGCPCDGPATTTTKTSVSMKTARPRKSHKQKNKNWTRRLCKANAIVSSITKCYEILNSRLPHS